MIYITGDTHRDFRRFTGKERDRLLFDLKKGDIVIIWTGWGACLFKSCGWPVIMRITICWRNTTVNSGMAARYGTS